MGRKLKSKFNHQDTKLQRSRNNKYKDVNRLKSETVAKLQKKVKRRQRIKAKKDEARKKSTEKENHEEADLMVVDHEASEDIPAQCNPVVSYTEIIQSSNVILKILDARDPMGCRCLQVEEAVRTSERILIFVLTKSDLVPKKNLESWVTHLSKYAPTIVFKSVTRNNSKPVGIETLMDLLEKIYQARASEDPLNVGIVGLPRVGKKSLIGTLRECSNQNIKIKNVPGLFLALGDENDSSISLKNASISSDNYISLVEVILERYPLENLKRVYHIPEFKDCSDFLDSVARTQGRFKRGGDPDQVFATDTVLNDWYGGKIKFYTRPSKINDPLGESQETSFQRVLADILQLPNVLLSESVKIESDGMIERAKEQDEEVQESQNEESDETQCTPKTVKKKRKIASTVQNEIYPKIGKMQCLKKLTKIRQKKEKKERRRRDRVAADLSHGMESAFELL